MRQTHILTQLVTRLLPDIHSFARGSKYFYICRCVCLCTLLKVTRADERIVLAISYFGNKPISSKHDESSQLADADSDSSVRYYFPAHFRKLVAVYISN